MKHIGLIISVGLSLFISGIVLGALLARHGTNRNPSVDNGLGGTPILSDDFGISLYDQNRKRIDKSRTCLVILETSNVDSGLKLGKALENAGFVVRGHGYPSEMHDRRFTIEITFAKSKENDVREMMQTALAIGKQYGSYYRLLECR